LFRFYVLLLRLYTCCIVVVVVTRAFVGFLSGRSVFYRMFSFFVCYNNYLHRICCLVYKNRIQFVVSCRCSCCCCSWYTRVWLLLLQHHLLLGCICCCHKSMAISLIFLSLFEFSLRPFPWLIFYLFFSSSVVAFCCLFCRILFLLFFV